MLFLMTRVDPGKLQDKSTNHLAPSKETISVTPHKIQKIPTYEDGVKILQHLFRTKIKDLSMQCKAKKAKKRYFIACKDGDIIKDSYWEFSLHKKRIRLLARSKSAIYIINKYHFKELKQDTQKAYPKVEKALIAFFNN